MSSATDSTNRIRLGMIGCGAISVIHGEAMQASSTFEFTACADRSEPAATAFAQRFGATPYTDMLDMVRAGKLDGVVLATWPAHHHDHVAQLVDAGVRFILCEKSLASSGPLALEILRKAEQAGATVIEGFMFRYHPLYKQLDDLVQDGEIGKIDTIRAGFQELDEHEMSGTGEGVKWRQTRKAGGGVALDGTCYPLHSANFLARSLPAKVSFDGEVGRFGTLVRLHGWVRYENGITGLIHSSLRAVVNKETEVTGTTGSLYLPIAYGFNIPAHDAIRKRTGINNLSMKDEILPPPRQAGEHENRLAPRLQLESFADVIRGKAPVRVPLIESVVNAYTMDAIVRSVKTDQVTEVEMPQAVRDAWHGRAKAA